MRDALLEIQDLAKYYPVTEGALRKVTGHVKAVDHVDLSVRDGETLGLVGESGCGKTTLGKCLVRLHRPTSGRILLRSADGSMQDLLSLQGKESFRTRRRIQMVFQDPYSSLNPVKNILSAFDEPLRIHGFGNGARRRDIVEEALRAVNLQPDYMYRFPHEFSGGQRQRICIARALSLKPEVVVCDEPVSALDVSIQAQILNLMKALQKQYRLTYVFIAHDLSVVQYMSDRVAVMYLGKVVELADSASLYAGCRHPYTEALLSAVPIPVLGARKDRILLSGDVPSPVDPPSGCRFHPRCPKRMDVCREKEPLLQEVRGAPAAAEGAGHFVACHLAERGGKR